MSDLSDRFIAALASTEGGYTQLGDRFLRAWPIIEAELQKRDKEHFDSLVKAESECLEETEQLSAKLTEANKLLEQTIEVLEEMQRISLWALDGVSSYLQSGAQECLVQSTKAYVDQTRNEIRRQAKPLLDNLKARKP